MLIHEGFVGGDGTNLLEFALQTLDPRHVLPDGPVPRENPPVVMGMEVWTLNVLPAKPAAPETARWQRQREGAKLTRTCQLTALASGLVGLPVGLRLRKRK